MAKASKKIDTNTVERIYKGADRNMLTAISVIMGWATTPSIKTFLFKKRSNWNDAFFKSITDAIDEAFKNVLGVKSKVNQVKATKELYDAIKGVKPKLKSFKEQVEIDFEDDNREQQILSSLGFGLWAKVQKDNQESLVELLATFNENMTPALQKEITDAGIDKAYITEIGKYAKIVNDANVKQEGLKTDSKDVTADGVTKLNKVYKEVLKVAQISASLYNEIEDSANADKFNYNKTLESLGGSKKGKGGKNGGAVEEVKK